MRDAILKDEQGGDVMGAQRCAWWQKIKQHPFIATGVTVAFTALIVCGFVVYFGWNWTGFNGGYNQITTTSTSHGDTTTTVLSPGKTLWDWMQLLLIPVILALGGFWLNQIQNARAQRTTQQQAELERELTRDNQHEAELQGYIDKMVELLLNEHLGALTPKGKLQPANKEVRMVANLRTLHTLRRLTDPQRKATIVQFLHGADLINYLTTSRFLENGGPIIDLSGADLIGANLRFANLSSADLTRVNLTGADLFFSKLDAAHLDGANLTEANLGGASLGEAYLDRTCLRNADLSGAILTDAVLSNANLSEANLIGTRLMGADLSGADLMGADLSGADLSGAVITKEQLAEAKSLKDAIMPNE
jgi:uncharacterized protein YjbI with pentapeptide repeats